MEYKICTKCGRELEVTKNFYKKGKNSDEYRSYCKQCGNNWQLKYYQENRKERVEYQKKYETNKRNKNKKYKIDEAETIEIKEQLKKYYEGEKKSEKIISNKVVRNKKLPNDYKDYFKANNNGKMFCEICGEWSDLEQMLQVHHILEISRYEKENRSYTTFEDVILLCCNCHKLTHLLGSIEEAKKYLNKKEQNK